jgi:Arm DNA-binding domain
MPRITKRLVDSLKPGKREIIEWDDEIPGFCLRITANGVNSYILKYWAGHGESAPIRKPMIGKHGAITADEAPRIAKDWKARVALGGDPGREREERANAPTMSHLCDEYLASHAHLKRSAADDRRMIERDIRPALSAPAGSQRSPAVISRSSGTSARTLQSRPTASSPCSPRCSIWPLAGTAYAHETRPDRH